MIRQLAHVCLYTRRFAAMTAFYGGTLGLPRQFPLADAGQEPFGWYFAAGNRTFIEIFDADAARARWGGGFTSEPPPGRYRHLCFEVDDLEAALARLAELGVPARWRGGGSAPQAFISDPDGNDIELMQYLPGARQLAPPVDAPPER